MLSQYSGGGLGYNTRCRSECALIAHQRTASWGSQRPAAGNVAAAAMAWRRAWRRRCTTHPAPGNRLTIHAEKGAWLALACVLPSSRQPDSVRWSSTRRRARTQAALRRELKAGALRRRCPGLYARARAKRLLVSPRRTRAAQANYAPMLDSIKAKAKAGADAAERSAKATKLKADIMLIENKLKTVKMEFGKDVYPAMAAGDRNTTETLFMTTKATLPSRVGAHVHQCPFTSAALHSLCQALAGGLRGSSACEHSRNAMPRRQSLDMCAARSHRRPRWRAWRRRLLRRGPKSRGSRHRAAAATV